MSEMATLTCRVCLSKNVRMHRIDSIGLQEMFEKVTRTKLNTDERPVTMCYICLPQLQNSHRFLKMCQTAEKTFTDLLKNGIEVNNSSLGMLNLQTTQHLLLSVAPTRVLTLGTDDSTNISSQETVVEELNEAEKNADIGRNVNNEMDEEHLQIEESLVAIKCNFDLTNKSTQETDEVELEEVNNSADCDHSVKDEMNEQPFQIENSYVSMNCNKDDFTKNKSQQTVRVEVETSEFVKSEVDEHFQTEESIASANLNNDESVNKLYQVTVKEEIDEFEKSADLDHILKDEMDEQHFETEDGFVSMSCNNVGPHYAKEEQFFEEKADTNNIGKEKVATMDMEHSQRVKSIDMTEARYKCHVCKRKFISKHILCVHLTSHVKIRLSCNVCASVFSCNSSLQRHMRTHTAEKPFTCNICDKTFTSSCTLKQHMRSHNGEKPFSRNICDKSFVCNTDLKRDTVTHTGERPFTRNLCDKSFVCNTDLKRDTGTHTGERPFSRNICDKSFVCNTDLKGDTVTHTGERQFSCNKCDKTYRDSTELKKHVRTHAGEKPFICTICAKKFQLKVNLNLHMNTHNNVIKPNVCNKCKKNLSQRVVLQADRPHYCTRCNKSYVYSYELKKHMRKHTGETPFSCVMCAKMFLESTSSLV